jgi:exopolysaccharide production protein ExoQ
MMNSVARFYSRSFLQNAKVPWIIFILLAAGFFVAKHDLLFSLREDFMGSSELMVRGMVEGNFRSRIVFSLLGLLGALALLRKGQNRLGINGVLGWLILFNLVWAYLSVAWAPDAVFTLRKLGTLSMLCLGALAVCKHFSLRNIILWVFFATASFLLIGFASEIALGTFRPLAPGYRFAGTLHPNQQGINCALLLLTGIAAGRAAKCGRWFSLMCAFVGIVFIVLTGSRTAFAAGIAALLVYWVLVSSRSRKLAWLLGLSIGAGVCLLVLLVENDLSTGLRQGVLLGRTDSDISSFSGRIPLWKEFLVYAARSPLGGCGYNSFFTPTHIDEISATQGWPIGEAHSAYLELLLGTGLVGMVSAVLILVLGIKRSIVRYKVSLNPGFASFVAIFIFCLLDGVLESAAVHPGFFSFVTMVALAHLGFAGPSGLHELDLERGR